MLHFFHTIKQLKTKDLRHSNNDQEVRHITYNPCAAFTANSSEQTMSGTWIEYLAMVTLGKRIRLNQWFSTFFMQRHILQPNL